LQDEKNRPHRRSNSRGIGKRFARETGLEEIKNYLRRQKAVNAPVVFYYRKDSSPRRIYNYYLDERYVYVRSDKGYYIKFLIDKIRKI
jgi:hypothetical protein